MAYSWPTPIDMYVWIGNTGFTLHIINLWFMSDNCPTVHPLKWKSDERQRHWTNLAGLDFYLCWSTWSVISISISLSLSLSHWVYRCYLCVSTFWVSKKDKIKDCAWPTNFTGQLILDQNLAYLAALSIFQGCFQPLRRGPYCTRTKTTIKSRKSGISNR